MSASHLSFDALPGNFLAFCGQAQASEAPAKAQRMQADNIAHQAATLLYQEVKAGNGLAGACRFVDFLRRHDALERLGCQSFDIDKLTSLVMLVADSPPESKPLLLHFIESLLSDA